MAGIRLTQKQGSDQASSAAPEGTTEGVSEGQTTTDDEVHVDFQEGKGGLFEIRGGKRVRVTQ